jgi:hypothetical protein
MAKANCATIAEYAAWLNNVIQPEDTLADWMEYSLTTASRYISSAAHAWEGMADQYRARTRTNPRRGLSYMAKENLYKIEKYANKLHDSILDNEHLPDWMENKIAIARLAIGDVKHAIEYQLSIE